MVNLKPEFSKDTKRVLFLKSEGFNSAQIRYICTKILKIKGAGIHDKINRYVKRVKIEQALRQFKNQKIAKKLQLKGLL